MTIARIEEVVKKLEGGRNEISKFGKITPMNKSKTQLKTELRLDTHNGTTKDDLLNIIHFLSKQNKRLRKYCASLESGELPSEGSWQ